jgi:RimJ/RimL family protein N-acetyltransferase
LKDIEMSISTQLFKGNLVCLGAIDHEKDPEVMARWSNDPEYLRMLSPEPTVPASTAQVKKRLEKIEKQVEDEKNLFYYTLRLVSEDSTENDRLLGFARIYWVEWNSGSGYVQLGIGEAADRRKGYGSETLSLLERFAFAELNLFSLRAVIAEYNTPALGLFEKAGFLVEARQRETLLRYGKRWDTLHVGILRPDWEAHS